jgi:hypothetical protein
MRTENIIYTLINFGSTYDSCQKIKVLGKVHSFPCMNKCDDSFTIFDNFKFEKNSFRRLADKIDIKGSLYKNGPIYAEMQVFKDFFYYKKGVYTNTTNISIGYHAVRVII